MLLPPNPTNHCFGCGGANARGMQLTFDQDDAAKRIRGTFSIGPEYQGATGFLHGGIIATLLDEVMAKVSRFAQDHAVTAELVVEYRKPVPVGHDLVVEGWETGRNGRVRERAGEIRNSSGVVLARGRATFIEVSRAQFYSSSNAGDGAASPESKQK
ncbi:MAG TPA: PaaI family thioesterase [Verrucomicrobiae bacterium]|nr:PaaI family thioesterase [Verrucomicrobiae bacterium]